MNQLYEKVLITGGYGFLGQNLAHELIIDAEKNSINREITIIARNEKPFIFPEDFNSPNVKALAGVDITDPILIDKHFQNIDVVYHLAGVMNMGRRNKDVLNKINIEGTKNVLQACLNNNVKILNYSSSVAAVGYLSDDTLITEDVVLGEKKEKHFYYGHSKNSGGKLLRAHSSDDLRVVIGLPSLIMGKGDLKTVPFFKIGRNWPIAITPKGGTSYIDVRDVAMGLIAITKKGEDKERYLLTSNNITHKQFIKAIAKENGHNIFVAQIPSIIGKIIGPFIGLLEYIMPKKTYISREGVTKTFSMRFYSNEKAKMELDWEPKYSLEDTIQYTSNWLVKEGLVK